MNSKNEYSLGIRIKQLRKELNLTQKELAEKAGLKTSAIISYENNQREPTGRALAALEKTLNVSGSYLFGDDINLAHYDKEIMDAVNESWLYLFSTITYLIKTNDPLTQKLIFNIMVELKSILGSKSMSNHQKTVSIELIHDLIMSLSIATDRANLTKEKPSELDIERNNTFKAKRVEEYSESLNKFFSDFHN